MARVGSPVKPVRNGGKDSLQATDTPWFVYMVRCRDGSLYCGATSDVARRVWMHADGKGARYTRARGVQDVALVLCVASRAEALSAEWHLKQWPRAAKLALVAHSHQVQVCSSAEHHAHAG